MLIGIASHRSCCALFRCVNGAMLALVGCTSSLLVQQHRLLLDTVRQRITPKC
jgi:hypothetical protein